MRNKHISDYTGKAKVLAQIENQTPGVVLGLLVGYGLWRLGHPVLGVVSVIVVWFVFTLYKNSILIDFRKEMTLKESLISGALYLIEYYHLQLPERLQPRWERYVQDNYDHRWVRSSCPYCKFPSIGFEVRRPEPRNSIAKCRFCDSHYWDETELNVTKALGLIFRFMNEKQLAILANNFVAKKWLVKQAGHWWLTHQVVPASNKWQDHQHLPKLQSVEGTVDTLIVGDTPLSDRSESVMWLAGTIIASFAIVDLPEWQWHDHLVELIEKYQPKQVFLLSHLKDNEQRTARVAYNAIGRACKQVARIEQFKLLFWDHTKRCYRVDSVVNAAHVRKTQLFAEWRPLSDGNGLGARMMIMQKVKKLGWHFAQLGRHTVTSGNYTATAYCLEGTVVGMWIPDKDNCVCSVHPYPGFTDMPLISDLLPPQPEFLNHVDGSVTLEFGYAAFGGQIGLWMNDSEGHRVTRTCSNLNDAANNIIPLAAEMMAKRGQEINDIASLTYSTTGQSFGYVSLYRLLVDLREKKKAAMFWMGHWTLAHPSQTIKSLVRAGLYYLPSSTIDLQVMA